MRNFKIEDILREAQCSENDKEIIKEAYDFAYEKHCNQKRKSGEPYIIHPLFVSYVVSKMGLDVVTISAALLHDVIEDTTATYDDVYQKFGEEIAGVVEGVTKLKKSFLTNEQMKEENYKKLFHAMEKDVRVILLKLADRLHNVYTLQYLDRKKQISIAKETVEIYAPIAGKLGLNSLENVLEIGAERFLNNNDKDNDRECFKIFEINDNFVDNLCLCSFHKEEMIDTNLFIKKLETKLEKGK